MRSDVRVARADVLATYVTTEALRECVQVIHFRLFL